MKVPKILPRDVFIDDIHTLPPELLTTDDNGHTVYPPFRPTGNSFMDAFVSLVHTYGLQTPSYYAQLMGIDDPLDLCGAIRAMSGISLRTWASVYQAKIVHSAGGASVSLAKRMHQGSIQKMAQSYKRYKKLAQVL